MQKLLCPSMMCADYGDLAGEVKRLEEAGCDIFHIDIMDGRFVPNFAMGTGDLEVIARTASRPVDAHLMIQNPADYVERFAQLGADIIYIHPEADAHAPRTLQKIVDAGAKPGIALNPGTALCTVEPLLSLCDYVMAMTVNPGFAGQGYLYFVDEKLEQLAALKEKYGYKLLIDGACSPERIGTLSKKGVDGFVLGTAGLFNKGRPYAEILPELRAL